jgi:dimethylargininase
MHFTHAITRVPADSVAAGLTTSNLGRPDPERSRAQFRAYVETLLGLGLFVSTLPPETEYPDSHFVEDTAVVMPELAVITHPGAPSRRGEVETIAPVLSKFRPTVRLSANAHMDGGDVLMIDKQFFVGLSSRTDEQGVSEFASAVEGFGYQVTAVEVDAGLHLKSIVNYVGCNTLLLSADGARNPAFQGYRHVVLDRDEEYAGNTLWINDTLITPRGYPSTRAKLQAVGLPVVEIDTSEFKKMDGGLTCLSLRF